MSHNNAAARKPARLPGPTSYFPSIEKNYGKRIEEWMRLIRTSQLTGLMDVVAWLKHEHGLGHGHANALVAHARRHQD